MSSRHAVLVAALAALLAACTTNPPPSSTANPVQPSATSGPTAGPSGPTATFDAALTPPPIAFAGLYVGNDVSVTGDATVAVVRSAMPCSALEHLIGAGEWAIVSRQVQPISTGTDARTVTILTLRNGAETALAMLAGGDLCAARIERTTQGTLHVAGTETFDGSVALDQPLCIVNGTRLGISVAYRSPNGPNVLLTFVAPVRLGTNRLAADDVTVQLAGGAMSLQQLGGIILEGFRDSTKASFGEAYAATEDSKARLEVESINPFVGTLRLAGFQGAHGAIDLDASIACHIPGGTIQRLFDATAAATPSGAPSTPGPTLQPVGGAAAGTIVATGGLVAGTYPIPASALDCYYDVDAGAWTISTASTADPNFYLYAFVAQGGGATERASLGLIRGDGSNGRIELFDTSVSPVVGVATHVQVGVSGSQVTVAIRASNQDGVTLVANLSCTAS